MSSMTRIRRLIAAIPSFRASESGRANAVQTAAADAGWGVRRRVRPPVPSASRVADLASVSIRERTVPAGPAGPGCACGRTFTSIRWPPRSIKRVSSSPIGADFDNRLKLAQAPQRPAVRTHDPVARPQAGSGRRRSCPDAADHNARRSCRPAAPQLRRARPERPGIPAAPGQNQPGQRRCGESAPRAERGSSRPGKIAPRREAGIDSDDLALQIDDRPAQAWPQSGRSVGLEPRLARTGPIP